MSLYFQEIQLHFFSSALSAQLLIYPTINDNLHFTPNSSSIPLTMCHTVLFLNTVLHKAIYHDRQKTRACCEQADTLATLQRWGNIWERVSELRIIYGKISSCTHEDFEKRIGSGNLPSSLFIIHYNYFIAIIIRRTARKAICRKTGKQLRL
jgi:hypothetical protein